MAKDEGLRQVIEGELRHGENILWTGVPDPMRLALKNWVQFAFGLVWLGFVIFMFSKVMSFGSSRTFSTFSNDGPPGIFSLVLVFFVIVGVSVVGSPFWEYWRGMKTVYAVTDDRILIVRGGIPMMAHNVKSLSPSDIETVERRQRADGSGDLILAREVRTVQRRHGGRRHYTVEIGFFGVENVRIVEDLVLDTFKSVE